MLACELGNGAFGVIGAEPEGVDEPAQEGVEAGVDRLDICGGVAPARDPTLIGDDDEGEAALGEGFARPPHRREEADEVGIAQVAIGRDRPASDEGVISIEEDGASHREEISLFGVVLGYADLPDAAGEAILPGLPRGRFALMTATVAQW